MRIGPTTKSGSLLKRRYAEEDSSRTRCSVESSVKIHNRFTPDSRPHLITLVQVELLIVSLRASLTVPLHLTLSLSPRIGLFKQGLFDERGVVAMAG